jgi:hypothetical protein
MAYENMKKIVGIFKIFDWLIISYDEYLCYNKCK